MVIRAMTVAVTYQLRHLPTMLSMHDVIYVQVTGIPMVMLSSGVTATTGMLAVFSDASVAVAHVTSQLSRLLGLFFRHFLSRN